MDLNVFVVIIVPSTLRHGFLVVAKAGLETQENHLPHSSGVKGLLHHSQLVFSLYIFYFRFYFILHGWMFCLHVHICATCITGACGCPRGLHITWTWSYDWWRTITWVLGINSGLLQQQQLLLTTRLSFQPLVFSLWNWTCLISNTAFMITLFINPDLW